ncbi:MAG: hypothetical protein WC415_02915 [Patescibacteria group bacterium]|jgi:hypothetical protein
MPKLLIAFTLLFCLTGCANEMQKKPIAKVKEKIDCFCSYDRYNCADFKTRREARDVYGCCKKKSAKIFTD